MWQARISISQLDEQAQSVATCNQNVATYHRNVATDDQNVATEDQSFATSIGVALKDDELAQFEKMVDGLSCTRATKEHIKEMFRRYGYNYTFRSVNVAAIFGVKTPGGATAILRKLKTKYNLGGIATIWYLPIH